MFNKKLKIELTTGTLPTRVNHTDAGFDLYSPMTCIIPAKGHFTINLGIKLGLSKGTAGLIYARSGLGTRFGITPRNKVGVVDEGYRDEVSVTLSNDSIVPYLVTVGDRIAQLVVTKVEYPKVVKVDKINIKNDRGGGHGSSGK